MSAPRYVVCIRCGYIMSWLQHSSLRFAMPCPDCGKENEFGPGVYNAEYTGITFKEATDRRRERDQYSERKP